MAAMLLVFSILVSCGKKDETSNSVEAVKAKEMIVGEGGKAVRRTIVTGAYQSYGVNIVSGLKYGDKLIVEGQQKVSSGTKVVK